jgi:hypothetical protein
MGLIVVEMFHGMVSLRLNEMGTQTLHLGDLPHTSFGTFANDRVLHPLHQGSIFAMEALNQFFLIFDHDYYFFVKMPHWVYGISFCPQRYEEVPI